MQNFVNEAFIDTEPRSRSKTLVGGGMGSTRDDRKVFSLSRHNMQATGGLRLMCHE
jgi:hypothetical protein